MDISGTFNEHVEMWCVLKSVISVINYIYCSIDQKGLHGTSIGRNFALLIWCLTFLIKGRPNLKSCHCGIIENMLCRTWLDLWEYLCYRFIFRKRLCFLVFTQKNFSSLLSESNSVYMGGVKLFVCWKSGARQRCTHTEGRDEWSHF